jgi:Ca2+-binding RTX toxin-like protein
MSHPFTGQNNLTGFAWRLGDLLWLNEVARRDPYRLYHARTATSGFSFGALQWDIPNHTPLPGVVQARSIFLDIMANATGANGQRIINDETLQAIQALIDVEGDPAALDAYLDSINAALDSEYGRQQIDANHVNETNALVAWVNNTVALVTDAGDNAFLSASEAVRLFIGDFRNQFGDPRNNDLRNFLQGGSVNLGTGAIQKIGPLGLADILNFYFSTPYATSTAGLNDELRRFNNIISVTGGYYALPDDPEAREEEAKGLIRVYQDFLKGKETQLGNRFTAFNANVLEFARVALIAKYVDNLSLGVTINGEVVVGEDQASFARNTKHNTDADTLTGTPQNDLMFGESGNDILNGGAGNDVLYGGTGNDTLKGGADFDYYMYYTGDGRDTIIDSDGQGQIRWDDTVLTGGQKLVGVDGDPDGVYVSADGLTYYVRYNDFLSVVHYRCYVQ